MHRNIMEPSLIESHRQPSLYYVSAEDDPTGPHLICDWNGPPTNIGEFDIDILSIMIDVKPDDEIISADQYCSEFNLKTKIADSGYNSPNWSCRATTNLDQSTLDEDDGTKLTLLTTPPIVNSLVSRLVRLEKKRLPNEGRHSPPSTASDKENRST